MYSGSEITSSWSVRPTQKNILIFLNTYPYFKKDCASPPNPCPPVPCLIISMCMSTALGLNLNTTKSGNSLFAASLYSLLYLPYALYRNLSAFVHSLVLR